MRFARALSAILASTSTPRSAPRRTRRSPSSAVSSSPSTRPHDGLHLGVGEQPEVAAVPADPAHLEATERRFHVALRGVDADVPGAQPLGGAEPLLAIGGEDVVVEAVVGAVGD